MEGIGMIFIDPNLIVRFLKERCHGNRFWAKLAKWPSFNTLAFQNGFEYRNSDSQLLHANIFAAYSANLIKIGPITPEIAKERPALF